MATRTNAVTTAPAFENEVINPFATIRGFEAAQRMAQLFAASPMVPQQYQNNVGSCVIALDIANRIGASPLMVMQNLYVVHGTPSWSSKFLVGCFNSCGRYTSITYDCNVGSEADKTKWYCVAKATILATGEVIESDRITWAMVEAEGWSKKSGSKWLTMPGQMFRYRAAAFLIRTHAPEISFGFYTQDEVMDGRVVDVEAHDVTEPTTTAPTATPEPSEAQSAPAKVTTDSKKGLFDNVNL